MVARIGTLVLLLLSTIMGATADAGRLYARKPNTASPLYNLRLTSMHTQVTIRNLLCVTHLDETFSNQESQELEGYYVFQLPQGATVDGLWRWVDGQRYKFVVKKKEDAQHTYDSLVQHGIGDPALLETLGCNGCTVSAFKRSSCAPCRRTSCTRVHHVMLPAGPVCGVQMVESTGSP
jgi:hypothetical protein